MKLKNLIVLTTMMFSLLVLVSCAELNDGLKSVNKSMGDFNKKHDAGPREPKLERKLFVYYKYLPNSKKGGNCNPTFVKEINEETMTKIAEIKVTAPKDIRNGGYQDYPTDKLKFHMRMDGCAMGADGFTKTKYTKHEAKGIAWAFTKNIR
jgi:hypothetical protein